MRDPDDLLAAVGLADEGDRPVGTWSKGMRGRLNLARALVADPELVFLDEPTSGLDPTNVAIVRDLVTDMSRTGVTVVLTTHDMATATALCDRVAFVVAGRVVACDSPRALQLAAHERHVVVEHLTPAGPTTTTFPLGRMSQELADLLASGTVERVRTDEPSLDEVFLAVTGGRP